MKIYLNNRLIIIETNLEFGIPYWTERKKANPKITWELIGA